MSACTVWVLGGTGLVGTAVCEALRAQGHKAVATGSEVDLTDPEQLAAFAQDARPSHIINCAAMTAVDACEDAAQRPRAMAINGQGPGHVAAAAVACGAAVLHISSDYVFDGLQPEPRLENDAVAPKSQYGASKLLGEQTFAKAVQGARVPHYILRTSWVFGPHGGNFVSTMLRHMAQRERVQVVADQHGRPTYTLDLAQGVLRLMGLMGVTDATGAAGLAPAAPAGLYHFANSGATTWHGLCACVLTEAKNRGLALRCQAVEPVTTAAFPRPAPRPAHSVLDTQKFEQATGHVPQPFAAAVAHFLQRMPRSEIISFP